MTSWIDRFKNSEFASVREHATMAEKEFKAAICIPNDMLPEYLQTKKEWDIDDRPGHEYDPETNEGGRFYGTTIEDIERRMAARQVEEKQISDFQQTKLDKEDRLMAYAAQWDAEENLEDDDKTPIEYHEDGPKFHQNAVNFLRTVMNHEDWEDFEEKCADTLEG
jgi:hypothetical protein